MQNFLRGIAPCASDSYAATPCTLVNVFWQVGRAWAIYSYFGALHSTGDTITPDCLFFAACLNCFHFVKCCNIVAVVLRLQVITQYLVTKYRGQGPDLVPQAPEAAARAWVISRIHDQYISPIQVLKHALGAGVKGLYSGLAPRHGHALQRSVCYPWWEVMDSCCCC